MGRTHGILFIVACMLFAADSARSGEIIFRGSAADTGAAVVETDGGQVYEAAVGEEIPGWGRVAEVREEELVLDIPTVDAEHGIEPEFRARMHVLRHDLTEILVAE